MMKIIGHKKENTLCYKCNKNTYSFSVNEDEYVKHSSMICYDCGVYNWSKGEGWKDIESYGEFDKLASKYIKKKEKLKKLKEILK